MSYCPNCGTYIDVSARFCPNCGAALAVVPVTPAVPTVTTVNTAGKYDIILVSRGTCARAVAIDLISDLLGYTDPEAARIIDGAPMEVAVGLTAAQAQYISQAFAEYGMEVSAFDGANYVDFTDRAKTSVFDDSGNFLNTVVTALAGLGIANRINSFTSWLKPQPKVFRPTYVRPAPVTAYRRRRPAPKPVVRHVAPPHPAPHVTPVRPVAPAPRPTPHAATTPVRPVEPVRPAAPRPTPHAATSPVRPVEPVRPAEPVRPVVPTRPGRPGNGKKPGGHR